MKCDRCKTNEAAELSPWCTRCETSEYGIYDEVNKAITAMEAHGSGWSWEITTVSQHIELRDVTRSRIVAYHTNTDGAGLWENGRQIEGTGQFSLPTDRAAARRKIRREFCRVEVTA